MPVSNRRSAVALALLATTMLTQPGHVQAEPGDALGSEFQVNTFTTFDQRAPAVAMDADGDFVVAWQSIGQLEGSYDVFAQRFDATGVAQGPEFQVNTFTANGQYLPAIAMNASGDFVVAWQSYGQDGSIFSIFAQRYDAAGVAQGPEFQVNTHSTDEQRRPAVAMDADGDFVVAWLSYDQDGSGNGIFAQRFNADGVAQSSQFQVNTFTTDHQASPAVAMDTDGDFVVAWQSYGQDGHYQGVFAQRYDAAGVAQDPEFKVNTFTTNSQQLPTVAMGADGDFVVAWLSYDQDGSPASVFAQRYDPTGVAQGSEFPVNTVTRGDQRAPAIAMDTDGDFVVTWQSINQPEAIWDVFAQRFDAAGVAQGPEFRVNSFTTNTQESPAIAMDADGDFIAAWQSFTQDGSFDGVLAQRYQGDGPVAGDFTVDGRADILWRNTANGNTNLWQMNGFDKQATGPIGAPGTNWQVRDLADFNADTKTDLLWRNTVTAKAFIWLMDGFDRLASGGIGAPGLDWQIVGASDFDGDDHADILWLNAVTGKAVIWLMDGLSRTAVGGIGGPPLVWEVAGVGDLDADARSDIVWRNTTNYKTVVWLMDGFSKLNSGTAGAPPLDWRVEGLGEFNGDARWDILWRNAATGKAVIWKMDGVVKEAAVPIGAPPLVWQVEGLGDTDGDRQTDIIWRHTGTGKAVVWQMDGFVKDAEGGIGAPPLVWEAQ